MSLFFILKSVCFSGHVDAATPLHVGLDRANVAGAEVLQVTAFDCSVLLLYDYINLCSFTYLQVPDLVQLPRHHGLPPRPLQLQLHQTGSGLRRIKSGI